MIYGERVRLRADERGDLPFFVHWLNDPEVSAGLLVNFPLSLDEEEQWYENMLKRPKELRPFAIETRQGDTWKLIGNCGYDEIDWRARNGEIGIFIGDKAYWNSGYGTEVMGLLVRHGFETLNLHRVFLRVFSSNPRAIRCYEKAGFVHEGCKRQSEFKNGEYVDELFMSILLSEWKG